MKSNVNHLVDLMAFLVAAIIFNYLNNGITITNLLFMYVGWSMAVLTSYTLVRYIDSHGNNKP